MANPVFYTIPANTWFKIATNETTGYVRILNPTDDEWYQTYRITTDPPPTEEPEVKMEFQSDSISLKEGSDVYIYHKHTTGRVRVDL